MVTFLKSSGEAQEKDLNKILETIEVLEQGVKDIFPDCNITVDDNNVGYLDFVICSLFSFHSAMEEVLGVNIKDSEKTPLLYSWVNELNGLALVKETIAPKEKMVAVLKVVREKTLKTSAL